jgi:hypothetical protein
MSLLELESYEENEVRQCCFHLAVKFVDHCLRIRRSLRRSKLSQTYQCLFDLRKSVHPKLVSLSVEVTRVLQRLS